MAGEKEDKSRITITVSPELKAQLDAYAEKEGLINIPDAPKVVIMLTRFLKMTAESENQN